MDHSKLLVAAALAGVMAVTPALADNKNKEDTKKNGGADQAQAVAPVDATKKDGTEHKCGGPNGCHSAEGDASKKAEGAAKKAEGAVKPDKK